MCMGVRRAKFACVAMIAAGVLARVGLGSAQVGAQGATATNAQRPSTAAGASAASASNTPPPPVATPIGAPIGDPLADLRLVPIDPGTEDVSRLWEGGRQMPVDLRKPLNFEQVYRVEGDLSRLGVLGVSPAAGESMYARASGGMVAVFPQSEYVRTKQGRFPVVPANTTFLQGSIQTLTGLPQGESRGSGGVTAASAAQRVDTRANVQPQAEPVKATATKREPVSIWTSEVARRSRLSQLLDEVKSADAAEEPDAPAVTEPAQDQKQDSEPTPASDQ
jgi:hypothetical protein